MNNSFRVIEFLEKVSKTHFDLYLRIKRGLVGDGYPGFYLTLRASNPHSFNIDSWWGPFHHAYGAVPFRRFLGDVGILRALYTLLYSSTDEFSWHSRILTSLAEFCTFLLKYFRCKDGQVKVE